MTDVVTEALAVASIAEARAESEHIEYGPRRRRRERLSIGQFAARAAITAVLVGGLIWYGSERFGSKTESLATEISLATEKAGKLQTSVEATRSEAVDGFCATIHELQGTQADAQVVAAKLDQLKVTAQSLGLDIGQPAEIASVTTTTVEEQAVTPDRIARFVAACDLGDK